MKPRTLFRRQELCEKVEVAVLGSPSVIVRAVSVDVKQHLAKRTPNTELRSCVRKEVDVLGTLSLIVPTVYVNVKQR